jgi:hypothetical protein
MTCVLCGLPTVTLGNLYTNDGRGAVDLLREIPAWVKEKYPCIVDWAEDSDDLTEAVPSSAVETACQAVRALHAHEPLLVEMDTAVEQLYDATVSDMCDKLKALEEVFGKLRDTISADNDKVDAILTALGTPQ